MAKSVTFLDNRYELYILPLARQKNGNVLWFGRRRNRMVSLCRTIW